jgi:hypothetical protein
MAAVPTLPSSAQEVAANMSFQKVLAEAPHHRSFSRALATFESQCRRLLSTQPNGQASSSEGN